MLQVMDNEIVDTLPAKTDHEFVQHPDRLTYPFIRENGREKEWIGKSPWTTQQKRSIGFAIYGPESIAFVVSARCANEEAFIFPKLCRSLFGYNHVDHRARL